MKASIVPIGNSKGIRIPKAILAQCNIRRSVILKIEKNKIVIIPEHKKIRDNWNKIFESMAENKHDKLLIDDKLDLNIWDWKW